MNKENICDICVRLERTYVFESSDGDYCKIPKVDNYNLRYQRPVNKDFTHSLFNNWCVYNNLEVDNYETKS